MRPRIPEFQNSKPDNHKEAPPEYSKRDFSLVCSGLPPTKGGALWNYTVDWMFIQATPVLVLWKAMG
ncbi:MAG: hypothetical protein ABIJ00_09205, partial [Candidatus Eisenbacteria bacterium]